MSPVDLKKTAVSHVFVARLFPCPLSYIRKVHVAMIFEPLSSVEFKKHLCRPVTKSPCRMLSLKKNGCVALSILRV